MKRFLLILLIIGLALPALAQEVPYFTALYWVKGALSCADPVTLDGRTVIFYKTIADINVQDISGATGRSGLAANYLINIYGNRIIEIDPDNTYYVAVARDPSDNYGANPVEVEITGTGFEIRDLVLELGAGPIVDLGYIRKSWIERDGDNVGANVILHWDYDPARPDPGTVDIWQNTVLDPDPMTWSPLKAAIPSIQKDATDNSVVRDGTNKYYRIVPGNTLQLNILDLDMNSYTLAKVDTEVNHLWNLVTVPLIPTAAPTGGETEVIDTSLDAVIGGQMEDNDQVLKYDMSDLDDRGYITATKTGSWGNRFYIDLGLGYWFYRDAGRGTPTINISFVGRVPNNTPSIRIEDKFNLIGYPYPVTVANLSGAGFVPEVGDQIMEYVAGTYDTATYQDPPGDWDKGKEMTIGEGYWHYREGAGYDWTPSLP